MILFQKYHGLGNDFVMVDYRSVPNTDLSSLAKAVCDRHTSIGADGLIVVKTNPLEMIYYNSDGSRAAMCGNGIRCFSQYAYDNNLLESNNFDVLTLAGTYNLEIISTEPFLVKVNMNKASYTDKELGINETPFINQDIITPSGTYNVSSLLMGVPHTVVEHDIKHIKKLKTIGAQIEKHDLFEYNTNVNFYELESPTNINMITYERGAGLTLACGTGACATFSHLYEQNQVTSPCTVSLPLGDLTLEYDNGTIYMTGPSEKSFGTYLNLGDLL